jgi:hypothetical protein
MRSSSPTQSVMRTRDEWTGTLHQKAQELEFKDGFHLLYCPWQTIYCARVAFISLNPGRAVPANMNITSDERGNSYEGEEATTLSPLTPQFLMLCRRFCIRPSRVLTGVALPFRSDSWNTLSPSQKREGLAVGKQFWEEALHCKESDVKLVITISTVAKKLALELTGAVEEKRVTSGWANTQLVRYRYREGRYVVCLPHLSSYKLFSRPSCNGPLQAIFGGIIGPNE